MYNTIQLAGNKQIETGLGKGKKHDNGDKTHE